MIQTNHHSIILLQQSDVVNDMKGNSNSTEISIICDMENLLKMTHISPYEMECALQRIKSDGLIDYDENKIIIKSRSRLIDSVFEKMST